MLARGRADVLHLNLGANASFWRKGGFALVGRVFSCPYVVHLHGSGFDEFWGAAGPIKAWAIRSLMEGATRIVVLGGPWRALVSAKAPKVAARIVVLPNATRAIARQKAAGAPVDLLFIGRLEWRKGVDVLVDALAALPPLPLWRATLAGDGEVEQTRRALAALGLAARVDCPGWLDAEAVEQRLSKAEILVLPSRAENMPMAVVEGFAAGLAVVATPVGAVPDLIVDGVNGLLVETGSPSALADALSRLIADSALRTRLGAAAKTEHARRLSIEPYTDALIDIWRAAAQRGGRRFTRAGYECARAPRSGPRRQ